MYVYSNSMELVLAEITIYNAEQDLRQKLINKPTISQIV